jgi:thiamine biosynthesis lipoprotein
MPANYFTSVSVFCKDGGLADALSTALFCMDYESGRALCDLLSVEAVWVTADGELLLTDGVELIK